jgi:hypothetical protein
MAVGEFAARGLRRGDSGKMTHVVTGELKAIEKAGGLLLIDRVLEHGVEQVVDGDLYSITVFKGRQLYLLLFELAANAIVPVAKLFISQRG